MSEPVALTSAQIKEASQALARAFFDDPYVEFIQPDPEKRLKPTETFMRTALRYGLRYGHVHVPAEGPQASAVWLPPGDSPAGTFRSLLCGIGLMPFQLGFSGTGKLFATLGYADGLHKKEMTRPHWYLWVLGVEPEKQGQGLGGRVLQPTLRRAEVLDDAARARPLETALGQQLVDVAGYDVALQVHAGARLLARQIRVLLRVLHERDRE